MKKENKNLFFASQIVTLAQKTMKINREKRIPYLHVPTPKSFEVFAKLWQLRLVPVNYPSTSNDDENLEIPARQRGQNATRQTRVTTKWDHGAQFGENSIAIPATGIRGPIFRVKDGRQGRETGPWVVRTDTSVATWKWISPRLPRPLLFKDEAYDSSPLLFSPSRPLSFPARDSRVENASSAKTPFARKDADNRNELLCIEIGEKEGRNVRNIF